MLAAIARRTSKRGVAEELDINLIGKIGLDVICLKSATNVLAENNAATAKMEPVD